MSCSSNDSFIFPLRAATRTLSTARALHVPVGVSSLDLAGRFRASGPFRSMAAQWASVAATSPKQIRQTFSRLCADPSARLLQLEATPWTTHASFLPQTMPA